MPQHPLTPLSFSCAYSLCGCSAQLLPLYYNTAVEYLVRRRFHDWTCCTCGFLLKYTLEFTEFLKVTHSFKNQLVNIMAHVFFFPFLEKKEGTKQTKIKLLITFNKVTKCFQWTPCQGASFYKPKYNGLYG